MGWALLLPAEAQEAVKSTELKPPAAISGGVAFLTTFFILSKVAWPGLAAKMEARELRIAEGLKAAEEAEARAREIAEKREQLLGGSRQEAQKLLADSRAAAENVKNDLMRAAQEEIAAEKERAKRE